MCTSPIYPPSHKHGALQFHSHSCAQTPDSARTAGTSKNKKKGGVEDPDVSLASPENQTRQDSVATKPKNEKKRRRKQERTADFSAVWGRNETAPPLAKPGARAALAAGRERPEETANQGKESARRPTRRPEPPTATASGFQREGEQARESGPPRVARAQVRGPSENAEVKFGVGGERRRKGGQMLTGFGR